MKRKCSFSMCNAPATESKGPLSEPTLFLSSNMMQQEAEFGKTQKFQQHYLIVVLATCNCSRRKSEGFISGTAWAAALVVSDSEV